MPQMLRADEHAMKAKIVKSGGMSLPAKIKVGRVGLKIRVRALTLCDENRRLDPNQRAIPSQSSGSGIACALWRLQVELAALRAKTSEQPRMPRRSPRSY
jgi:hypothetical protein